MPGGPADTAPRPLLPRLEREVLRQLAAGRTLRQSAAELSYSYDYLRTVRAQACKRLGASTTAQAVYIAARHGLI